MRTDKLREEHGVQYKWTVYPLHADTPEEGMDIADLFTGRDVDLDAMHHRLASVARHEGLEISPRSRTYNSRRAQELGKLAEKLGLMDPYQQSVYRAFFVEGRNIALIDEIVDIAKRAGVPEDQARAALAEGTFAKEVDDDWNRGRLLGVTGVPAFICNGKIMEGFHPYIDFLSLAGIH